MGHIFPDENYTLLSKCHYSLFSHIDIVVILDFGLKLSKDRVIVIVVVVVVALIPSSMSGVGVN